VVLGRSRWRFRISTLMLVVIIAALAIALLVERWRRELAVARLQSQLAQARDRAAMEQLRARKAQLPGAKIGGPIDHVLPADHEEVAGPKDR
jgi:hypothetical protein